MTFFREAKFKHRLFFCELSEKESIRPAGPWRRGDRDLFARRIAMLTPQSLAVSTRPGRWQNIALWSLQVLLAAAFLGSRGCEAGRPRDDGQAIRVLGLGQWFRYLTGILEIAAAILLLIPRQAGYGALLLIPIMLGAAAAHLVVFKDSPVARWCCSCWRPSSPGAARTLADGGGKRRLNSDHRKRPTGSSGRRCSISHHRRSHADQGSYRLPQPLHARLSTGRGDHRWAVEVSGTRRSLRRSPRSSRTKCWRRWGPSRPRRRSPTCPWPTPTPWPMRTP